MGRRLTLRSLLGSVALSMVTAMPATAELENCTATDYAAAVDRSGAALSRASREVQPRIQERMRILQKAKGLNEGDYESAALEIIQDSKLDDFDARSSELLLKIDGMGRLPEGKAPSCAEVADIDKLGKELLGVVRAKSEYILTRLDAEIVKSGGQPVEAAKPAPAKEAAAPKPAKEPEAKPKEKEKEKEKEKDKNEAVAIKEPTPPPAAKPKAQESWPTATARPNDSFKPVEPEEAGIPAPIPGDAVAPAVDGYTIEEVQEASRGFFGTISTSLASVIEHAFKTTGRPTAYVLGTEGGGAFLAGLRFGEGTLYMRNHPETRKVWWHGPSIGGDFGASGTRTMFLIYKLPAQDALYRTFTGVDGSAFFVGGVGMTVLKGGEVIMAPIRTGIGLRVGASVGYVRFTPKPTWNPF